MTGSTDTSVGSASPIDTTVTYTAVKLEKNVLCGLLARKYAQLNVKAIRAIQGPDILLYAQQLARSAESWTTEFEDDDKLFCWICVAPDPRTGDCSLQNGQWVGMYQLHGPLSPEQYNFFHDERLDQECRDDGNTTTRWIGGRLYVKPQHRNFRAFRTLENAWTAFVGDKTLEMNATTARVQVTAYYETSAHEGHKASGLRVLRELTRVEDLAYDGLLDAVPEGMLQETDYSDPVGTFFEMAYNVDGE